MDWISVKDMLPKCGEVCLIYVTGMEICDGMGLLSNKYEWYWWTDCIGDLIEGEVTHWMTLPEKPKDSSSSIN